MRARVGSGSPKRTIFHFARRWMGNSGTSGPDGPYNWRKLLCVSRKYYSISIKELARGTMSDLTEYWARLKPLQEDMPSADLESKKERYLVKDAGKPKFDVEATTKRFEHLLSLSGLRVKLRRIPSSSRSWTSSTSLVRRARRKEATRMPEGVRPRERRTLSC